MLLTSRQSMPSTDIYTEPLFDSDTGGWRKYTMPVLSPRRSASSTLTGSYRSTFSSSSTSIERPYYSSATNSYTPRSTSYISRSYSNRTIDDNSREKSVRRDSLETNNVSAVIRDSSTSRGVKSSSVSSVVESVADLRNRYSPANYVPAVLRGKTERSAASTNDNNILRSKSINDDIGRPPLEIGVNRKASDNIRKKVNDSFVCNRVVFQSSSSSSATAATATAPLASLSSSSPSSSIIPSNNTNGTSDNNPALLSDSDDNGNRNSVAEICKKFDSKSAISNNTNAAAAAAATNASIIMTNAVSNNALRTGNGKKADAAAALLLLEGAEIKLSENRFKKMDSLKRHKAAVNGVAAVKPLAGDVSHIDVVRKCSSGNSSNGTAKIASASSKIVPDSNAKVCGEDDHELAGQAGESSSISSASAAAANRNNNHTTDFASYIPYHQQQQGDSGSGAVAGPGGGPPAVDSIAEETPEMERNGTSNHLHYQGKSSTPTNDLSTSPRLNRAQGSPSPSTSSGSSSGIISSNILGASGGPSAHAIRSLGLNGLKNIGNTCFMNSVIQCLSNTKLLLEYLKRESYMLEINTTNSGMKGALIKAFSQVIKELWSEDSTDRVVNTLAFKNQIQRFAPRFMGYSQQDAQEFLRYLLEGLHEDVNRVTVKPTPIHTEIDEKLSDSEKAAESWQRYLRMDNSRIVDIFVGQLKSTLRCTYCGHCSVTFDPFWDLSLPIPQRQGPLRLAQCLEHFTREETMDGDEKPTCSKCKERRKCTKSFTIQKFPKILVIHLKRFSPTERFRGKLSVTVDFPLEGLDMRAYAAADSPSDCRYNLYAISNHSGTTYSGHYTAYCRHPYSHQWHEYNDSRVSSISAKSTVSGEAYVLFYELESQKSHL